MSKCKLITTDVLGAFKYDLSSPSYLSWNIDIRCGKYLNFHKIKPGQPCTDFNKQQRRYYVEFRNKRYIVSRIIYFLHNPDHDQSKLVDHIDGNTENNSIENLRLVCAKGNARNRASDFKGITFTNRNGYDYWRITWVELNGVRKEKFFSCLKLGADEARMAAIEFRLNKIEELNIQGAGYTERHYR